MIYKTLIGVLTLLMACACSQQNSKKGNQGGNDSQQNLKREIKLKIENGNNQGIRANAKLGIKDPAIYTTSIIRNEGVSPINLQLALSKEYEFPAFCGDSTTYKVFLLPKELTPDTATLWNSLLSPEDAFMKSPLDNPTSLNKTLKPGEYAVVTMGALYPGRSNCEVVPRAVFSHLSREEYPSCDTQVNPAISADPQLQLGIKLEFYKQRKFIPPEDHCILIPCGQVSYPEQ